MGKGLFPTRWKNDKPPSIEEFVDTFRDDYACAEYLAKKRWPEGFACPCCGSKKAWRLESRPWLFECAGKGSKPGCRKQTSVIAGTVMQGTHLPLRKWFIAAYLMATHSNSISALQLQPKLGVTYKTAWLVLHKLRRAMVDPDRMPLSGTVDVDESAFSYRRGKDYLERGGGSSTFNQIWFACAVETHGKHGVGRIRLARIRDRSAASIVPFVVANTVPGTHLRTDALASYDKVPDRPLTQVNLTKLNLPAHIVFKWIHMVFGNLKHWAWGTFHGFREKHLDAYLNEFVFRWNRRRSFRSNMDTMLGIGRRVGPATHRGIVGDTTEWKRAHIDDIMEMCHPNKQQIVRDIARLCRVHRAVVIGDLVYWADRLQEEQPDVFNALHWSFEGVREFQEPVRYARRKKPLRPVLAPRRVGEERQTSRRYRNPAALLPQLLPQAVSSTATAAIN
jgi:hypothetical protein